MDSLVILFILLQIMCYNKNCVAQMHENLLLKNQSLPRGEMEDLHDFCLSHRGEVPSNQTKASLCCNETYEKFITTWDKNAEYLTELLATLKGWRCPQFVEECKEKHFSFNKFTELVYNHACNKSWFDTKCIQQIQSVTKTKNSAKEWKDIVRTLRSIRPRLNIAAMEDPCIQVALYDSITYEKGNSYGYYHEIKRVFLPFCEFVWCGVDAQAVHDFHISAWLCMPYTCRRNVILSIVACGLLGLSNVILNVVIILVTFSYKELRNSQGVYRISLAFAGLIAGAIIYPTFITSLNYATNGREVMGPSYNNVMSMERNVSFDSVPHFPGGNVDSHFDDPYLKFTGFCTSIHLTVTTFSLVMACVDRLAFYRSHVNYSRSGARRSSTIIAIALWVISVGIAIVPFFVHNYNLIASVMILSSGETSIYIYLIGFIIPILLMWLFSLITLCLSLKRNIKNQAGNAVSDLKSQLIEEDYHSRTLNIMIGVFSACILVGCIPTITALFQQGISYDDPINLVEKNASNFTSSEFVAVIFLTSSGLWNFPIYFFRDNVFKRSFFVMLGKLFCQEKRGSMPNNHFQMEDVEITEDLKNI